jgi:hypothetical protein
MERRKTPAADGSAGRCIILTPAGQPVPAALVRALGRRHLAATVVTEGPAVLANLAYAPATAVIAMAPDQIPQSEQLARALRMYHPAVRCWQLINSDTGPRLAHWPEPNEPADHPPAPAATRVNGAAKPAVQPSDLAASANGAGSGGQASAQPGATFEPATVTEAELAALLPPSVGHSSAEGSGEQSTTP